MLIIGCDFHSRFQQIAMADSETGEFIERRLAHSNDEAKKFSTRRSSSKADLRNDVETLGRMKRAQQ
jgi:hypothetical protein